jgi:MFS family permease
LAQSAQGDATIGMTDVLRYLRQHRRSYVPVFGSVAALSILGYGYLNWYPTFLIRTYQLEMAGVGKTFGILYLVFGSLGALCGALLSESLARRGRRDANLRVIAVVASLLLLTAALGPMMPTATLALIVAAPTLLLLNAFYGAAVAALQFITPNRMRGVVSAMFLLANTLVGLAVGTALVAFLTDFVFHDDLALRYSLVVVVVLVCPIAAVVAWRGLPHYRAAATAAAAWHGS